MDTNHSIPCQMKASPLSPNRIPRLTELTNCYRSNPDPKVEDFIMGCWPIHIKVVHTHKTEKKDRGNMDWTYWLKEVLISPNPRGEKSNKAFIYIFMYFYVYLCIFIFLCIFMYLKKNIKVSRFIYVCTYGYDDSNQL